MAKRNSARGSRARKRRSATAKSAAAPAAAGQPRASGDGSGAGTGAAAASSRSEAPAAGARRPGEPRRRRGPRSPGPGTGRVGVDRDPGGVGARPQAPWHPVPVAELLILIGLIAVVAGASEGASGFVILVAGVAAVVLGTLEFSVREHLSGYRAHSSLLAAVPTAILHGGLALLAAALKAPSSAIVLAPLALDIPVFAVLFKLLRARFEDARRERVQALRH